MHGIGRNPSGIFRGLHLSLVEVFEPGLKINGEVCKRMKGFLSWFQLMPKATPPRKKKG